MEITLLIHTNSAYQYLWPIVDDYVKNIQLHKILAYDSNATRESLPKNFHEYISYDGSLKYSKRMSMVLDQIHTTYILLVHDVDIIINIDTEALKKYLAIIDQYYIDRCSTTLFNGTDILGDKQFAICNLNAPLKTQSMHFIPADCTPVIWKRSSFKKLCDMFPEETYRSMESTTSLIDYCKSSLKCYGIQLTDSISITYNRNLTMSQYFLYFHITTQSLFLYPTTGYMDMEYLYYEIVDKYKLDVKKIGTTCALHTLRSHIPLLR